MNFKYKALATVALAAYLGTALAADPIKIGVGGPFTGGSSSMGVSMRDGVRLAVDEINKAGGLLGRKIEPVDTLFITGMRASWKKRCEASETPVLM